jgi:hypothetical protein
MPALVRVNLSSGVLVIERRHRANGELAIRRHAECAGAGRSAVGAAEQERHLPAFRSAMTRIPRGLECATPVNGGVQSLPGTERLVLALHEFNRVMRPAVEPSPP